MINFGSLKTIIKLLAIFFVTSLLLVAAVLLWLVKTESGLRWALQQAPDTLSVSKISGDLSALSFSGLTLRLDGTQVHIASGELNWVIADLVSKKLTVNKLVMSELSIQVISSGGHDTEPYTPWAGIDLPIDIEVKKFAIDKLVLIDDHDELARFDQLNTTLTLTDNVLEVKPLSLTKQNAKVELNGKIDLSAKADGAVSITNEVHWQDNENQATINGSIIGTWNTLALTQQGTLTLSQHSSVPFETSVLLNIDDVLTDNISWQGTLKTQENKVQASDKPNLHIGQGNFDISGKFSPSAGLSGLVTQVSGSITADNEQFSDWKLVTDVEFENDTLKIRRFDLLEQLNLAANSQSLDKRAGNAELKILGSVTSLSQFLGGPSDGNALMNLSGSWDNLGWPLNALTRPISSSGDFNAVGVPDDFRVTARASGEAYQKTITAHADIQVVDQIADINALTLRSGSSLVDVSGRFGDELALTWNIASLDLSELVPGSSGDLVSRGKLDGNISAPRFSASATSAAINYNDVQIRNLDIAANGLLSASADAISVNASVEQIKQGSTELVKDLILTVNGTGQAHTLSIESLLFGQSVFTLNGQGAIKSNRWMGQLLDLSWDDAEYGKWELEQPVELIVEDAGVTADKACLKNQKQSICMSITTNNASLTANADVHELELSNFNPLLGLYDASVSGIINGKFDYQKKASAPNSTVLAELVATNSVISIAQANAEPQSLTIAATSLTIAQDQTITASANLVLENEGTLSAELSIASAFESLNFSTAKLTGHATANLNDLSRFQAIISPLSDLKGSFNADIDLNGSLSEPIVGMQTELSNGEVKIPDLGLELTDIALSAKSSGEQKVIINGAITSGDGLLRMTGDLDLSKPGSPRVAVFIKGDNIELMKTPEVHVDGDIDASIVITDDLIDVNGNIALVQADLDFQLPENAILASEDVVLMGEEQVKNSSPHKIRLKVDLGDQTHIRAQGLDATLVGSLDLQQDPGEPMRANGQIDIKNGRYSAYNQNLEIDKGQLIYNGGPIDDPSLVLRAQKSVDSITAGVSVSGTASSPNLALYSTPSMSDQDVLSVLLFDKRLGDLASQDGLTLLRIANSLRGNGASKSKVDVLTQGIQESLGLSNLELQLNGNSPSLTAGKQLSSKFYIGYGYGLLDAAQSLILRYKISRSWSIQGDLGVDSGADLRYQIER